MAKEYRSMVPQNQNVTWGTLTTANTAKDGTGTVVSLGPAGANGARVDQIKVRALGSNVATVLRLFQNNGQTNATASNNSLIHEVTIAQTTLSEVAALADNDITITKNSGEVTVPIPYLPAGHKILATIGTTVAAGLQITAHIADY